MKARRRLVHGLALLAAATVATAEDGVRLEGGYVDGTLAVEYRMRGRWVDPLQLNGEAAQQVGIVDQRLRARGELAYRDRVRVHAMVDALDGVLAGDNGVFGDVRPSAAIPFEGISTSTVSPSGASTEVAFLDLLGDGDVENPDNYGLVLDDVEDLEVRRLYGEVLLPVGLLRVGRQRITDRAGILAHPGDADANEWGTSDFADSVDRVVFGTKPMEIAKVVAADFDASVADPSRDRGYFFALALDVVSQGRALDFLATSDDVLGVAMAHRWRWPELELGGLDLRRVDVDLGVSYRFGGDSSTRIGYVAMPVHVSAHWGTFRLAFDGGAVLGRTREIAHALSFADDAFGTDPGQIREQDIRSFGARLRLGWERGAWDLGLEVDFATGDDDPVDETITQFFFARDANVDVLLFERVLAFETAQSSAVGSANLRKFEAPLDPSTAVATDGRFFNALAVVPRVDWRPSDSWLIRVGVLVAWAPSDVVDPVVTRITKVPVNFHGGDPAERFYGIEPMARIRWSLDDHFFFDLEGAGLFPGPALEDERGEAVRSFAVSTRFTFRL